MGGGTAVRTWRTGPALLKGQLEHWWQWLERFQGRDGGGQGQHQEAAEDQFTMQLRGMVMWRCYRGEGQQDHSQDTCKVLGMVQSEGSKQTTAHPANTFEK